MRKYRSLYLFTLGYITVVNSNEILFDLKFGINTQQFALFSHEKELIINPIVMVKGLYVDKVNFSLRKSKNTKNKKTN